MGGGNNKWVQQKREGEMGGEVGRRGGMEGKEGGGEGEMGRKGREEVDRF